ncbi:M48 family metallopeptidase [Thauera sinica]|uniref:M48 family metallopeptidase n=1 Tax=Thauera sinica TaxID=2665146 RepID=A0ABW1AV16_9RHOO|nr:M48 family metallopeptidase [Thauera sp. K11]
MTPQSRVFDLRSRLARRLGLLSTGCLLLLIAALLGMLATVFVAMGHSWEGVLKGDPTRAGLWSLLAVTVALSMVRLVGVVCHTSPLPQGIRLPRQAAEDFYRLMDDIAASFGIPPVQHVWISCDMNAVVLQRPAWGWIGPIRTHLLIGLPLAHSVSAAQLAAVLAHEFAHLARQRSGLGAQAAHLRAWWARVLDEAFENFPWAADWLERRAHRFYRDMLRLARLEEFEADACAAQVVGRALMGETLVEIGLKARFLEQDYWPKVMAQSMQFPSPSIRPYREMGLGVAAGFLRRESVAEDLSHYEAGGGSLPLHPTLHERLRALGTPLRAAAEDQPSAAGHYFAPLLPTLAWAFDRAWWEDAREDWQQRYLDTRDD